jgi:anaerobic ribonucleoside-triphosphate reductase activating protein
MNYANIKEFDIADGPGVRISLFVSGCRHHCKGCFNAMTWDFNYGKPFTKKEEDRILELLAPSYIQGLTVLGGEPFEPENQREIVKLIRRVRKECPGKTIWMYSGNTYEEMLEGGYRHIEVTDEILDQIDVLVDGRFEEELKDISLNFRGSSNQRIIDMKKTRASGEVVLHPLND